jgi:hypothetical protein
MLIALRGLFRLFRFGRFIFQLNRTQPAGANIRNAIRRSRLNWNDEVKWKMYVFDRWTMNEEYQSLVARLRALVGGHCKWASRSDRFGAGFAIVWQGRLTAFGAPTESGSLSVEESNLFNAIKMFSFNILLSKTFETWSYRIEILGINSEYQINYYVIIKTWCDDQKVMIFNK